LNLLDFAGDGEGFVRISLTVPDKRLEEAMQRIEKNSNSSFIFFV